MTFKQGTKKLLGIDETQYKKLYKDYYYKLRTFEAETGAERRDAAKELYYTIKGQKSGEGISKRREQVLRTPAMSKATRTRLQATKEGVKMTKSQRRALAYGENVFGGLIKSSKIAAAIWTDETLSPTEKLKKLRQYADDRIKKGKAKERSDGTIDADDFDDYGGYDALEGW